MVKKYKILFSVIIAILLTINLCKNEIVKAGEELNSINGEQAQKIAIMHIQSSLLLSENEVNDNWHWGMLISEPMAIYDLNGNINSYYFSLSGEDKMDAGYIIIGANESYAPILEYSTSGSFQPVKVMKENRANRLYYAGGLDYFIYNNENYKDMSGNIADVTIQIGQRPNVYSTEKFSDEWRIWKNKLSDLTLMSNPPTSGGVITKPDDYEKGYQNKSAKNVKGYNLSYKKTSDFNYTNHCAPTAATNIMLYWYNRSSYSYGKLRRNNDNTWKDTFERLYSLMGTSGSGTSNANLSNAYTTYYEEAGYNPFVTYYSTASWDNMKTEIDNEFPFHMIVQGHYYYGDHSIVGVGYEEYKYNIFSYSRYIRIVDGFASSSGRFIHTSVGNSQIRMVRVRP